jgi:hypothetical protein
VAGAVGAKCGGNGVGEGESRWALTRHLSVGGVELRVMMDSVGQWEYVVEMVRMCARAMWPR